MSESPVVAVFGSSNTAPDSEEWANAEGVGRSLAEAGFGVITGGYGGTMEAVSKGSAEAGGHVIGVISTAQFPHRPGANRYVTEVVDADSLANRIGALVGRAAGVIALPGSIGTATELLIAWNHNHIVRNNGGKPLPAVAVGVGWRSVAELLVNEIGAHGPDVHIAATAAEAVRWLIDELKNRAV